MTLCGGEWKDTPPANPAHQMGMSPWYWREGEFWPNPGKFFVQKIDDFDKVIKLNEGLQVYCGWGLGAAAAHAWQQLPSDIETGNFPEAIMAKAVGHNNKNVTDLQIDPTTSLRLWAGGHSRRRRSPPATPTPKAGK